MDERYCNGSLIVWGGSESRQKVSEEERDTNILTNNDETYDELPSVPAPLISANIAGMLFHQCSRN